jgi:hypothetical protein
MTGCRRTCFFLIAALLTVAGLPPTAFASYYIATLPKRVDLEFQGRGSYKRIIIHATAEKDRLARLTVDFDGQEIAIPSPELAKLAEPDLRTFEVRYDGYDPSEVYLYLEFGTPDKRATEFHFKGRSYVGLTPVQQE